MPYTEPRPLADAIMPLLTDPAKRAAMGGAARRLAEQRFDAGVWAERLHAIYTTAIDTRSRRRSAARRRLRR